MNPYKILGIDSRAGKKEILEAAARALRERRFSCREVAVAQKELLNPVTRRANDFLHVIDLTPLREGLSPKRPARENVGELIRLSIFDKDS